MSFKILTTLILLFLYEMVRSDNILGLFINGHHSHLIIYASVINLLAQRGHNITVITTLDIKDIMDLKNIKWIKLNESYTSNTITNDRVSGLDKIEGMLNRIESSSKFMHDSQWQSFMKADHKYDLMLMGYLFNDYQLGVAAHFKCPVILIWTGQPIGFVQSLMGNPKERWYVTQPYDNHQFKGLPGQLFGWFEDFVEFLSREKMKEIYEEHFPTSNYPLFKEIRKTVSLVLCNHHSLSEGPIAPYVPGIIEIGGIKNKYQNQENQIHLDTIINDKTKVIYISFGSRVKWSILPNTLEEIFIKAFQKFPNYTILWTYDKNCSKLQTKFPASNVKCRAWWPQTNILASKQTKLFITHGGKGSLTESQLYGVPMLGISFIGDQKPNVDKIQKKNFGLKLQLENISYETVVKSLQQLLTNDSYGNNIKRFSKLYHDRPLSSEQTAVYWVEYVLRHRGAKHLQSPRLLLNWWEYYLLDLYSFVLVCFVGVIWLLNKLENKITALVSYSM